MVRPALLALGLAMATPAAAASFGTTAAFLASEGVAAFVGGDPNTVTELQYLRMHNVRAWADYPSLSIAVNTLQPLCDAGMKLDLIHEYSSAMTLEMALGRSCVAAVEGPNEINLNVNKYKYLGLTKLPAVMALIRDMKSAAQAWDPTLPVLTPSEAFTIPAIGGDLSAYATLGNFHVYCPPYPIGFGACFSGEWSTTTAITAPKLPFWITETGSSTSTNGVSEHDQAVLTVTAFLDGWVAGAGKTFVMRLSDAGTCDDDNDGECRLGLFNSDGTPKWAARAVRAFNALLASPSALPLISNPQPIAVGWTGLPSDARFIQLQSNDGAHRVIVWRENAPGRTLATAKVTLTTGGNISFGVSNVLVGTANVQPRNTGSSVTFTLGLEPMVIDIR